MHWCPVCLSVHERLTPGSHWFLDRIGHHLFGRLWCQPPPFTTSSASPFLSHSPWLQAVLSSGLLHPAVKVCSIDSAYRDVGEHDQSPVADRCCSPCKSISYSSSCCAGTLILPYSSFSLNCPKTFPLSDSQYLKYLTRNHPAPILYAETSRSVDLLYFPPLSFNPHASLHSA